MCRGLRHLHWARDRLRWRSPWSRLPRGGAMDVAHADDDGPEDSPKKRKKKKEAKELDTDEL